MDQADSVHSTPPINTSATDESQSPTKPRDGVQDGPLYIPTDVTPEELFKAIGSLRKEARDEIDRLIRFLDESDNHMELEEAVDDVPCDDDERELGEGDDEPSLGSHVLPSGAVSYSIPVGRDGSFDCEGDDTPSGRSAEDEPSLGSLEAVGVRGGQEHWAQGAGADQEGDAHEDDEDGHDREGDELQHGGDEHDGAEPDEDGEPLLGWTEPRERGQQALGDNGTEAEQGSTCPGDLRKGKARYRKRDRSGRQNRDGMHVDAEAGFGNWRRLRNLSEKQKEIVKPRLDRDAVVLT
jgi:hypothetical protein